MTTDQLERDLKALAEPRPEDEQLRRSVRTTLHRQLQPRPKTRTRRRLAFGVAGLAAASLAAALVALVGNGGPSSANAAILAHVTRASSTPANMIVHVKETGFDNGTPVSAEWWQETTAPYALRLIKGAGGQETESSADGSTYSQYDPGTNTVYQQPRSSTPTLVDPIQTMRADLRDGTAHVAGTVTIDGQSLYKIELADGLVAYFDKTDYRPVYIDNPQRDSGRIVRTRVVAYDELPITTANEQLLSVGAQHPGARVASGEAPAPTKPAGAAK